MFDRLKRAYRGWNGTDAAEIAALRSDVNGFRREVKMLRDRSRAIASGVAINYGKFEDDANEKLRGVDRWPTLEKMQYDAHVKAALRFNTLPLLTAEWSVEPASEEDRDVEIADFVSANLLRDGENFGREFWCQTSWQAQRLPEILSMLPFGFSMFHKTTKAVGRYRVFDRLQWIEPSSVDPRGWNIDDADEIIGVRRTFALPSGEYKFLDQIDAERLMLYVWDLHGARYQGVPFTRSMYGPWFRKDLLARMAAIWAQKVGDPIPVGVFPKGWPPNQVSKFEDFIQMLRGLAPAYGYGMFEADQDGKGPEINFPGADTGEVDRMRGLINGENAEIAHAGNVKAMLAGETTYGSRSVAESQAIIEMLFVQAIGEIVCEWENHGVANLPGLVEELVDMNYENVKGYPHLTVSRVNPFELRDNMKSITEAVQAGIIPKHPALKRQITERFGFDLPDDAYEVQEPPPLPAVASPNDKQPADQQPNDQNPSDSTELAATAKEEFRKRITPWLAPVEDGPYKGSGFRRPNRLEAEIVNLAAVDKRIRTGERDVLTLLRDIRRRMTQDLMRRLRAGKITARNLDTQRRSKFRGYKAAHSQMKSLLAEISYDGVGHVDDELKAQGAL